MTSAAPHRSPASRAALGFTFVTVVLGVLALGIVIPVLPLLAAGAGIAHRVAQP